MFRIAYTLSQLAFLVHDPQGRFYTLGPAVLRLGYGYRSSRDLIAETLPQLEALRDATEWSAHLGVLEGTEVVYLLRVPARRGLASIVDVGSRLPAHATSMGRVLLAQLSRAELITRYQDAQLIGVGPRTPTTVSALLAQARRDFSRAYVIHMGEFEQGVAKCLRPPERCHRQRRRGHQRGRPPREPRIPGCSTQSSKVSWNWPRRSCAASGLKLTIKAS